MLFDPSSAPHSPLDGDSQPGEPLSEKRLTKVSYDSLDEIGAASILARLYPNIEPIRYEEIPAAWVAAVEKNLLGQSDAEFWTSPLQVTWLAVGSLDGQEIVSIVALRDDQGRYWLPPEFGEHDEAIEHAVVRESREFVGFLVHQFDLLDFQIDSIAGPTVIQREIQRFADGKLDGMIGETFSYLLRTEAARPQDEGEVAEKSDVEATSIRALGNLTTSDETIGAVVDHPDGSIISFKWNGRGDSDLPTAKLHRFRANAVSMIDREFSLDSSADLGMTLLDGLTLQFTNDSEGVGGTSDLEGRFDEVRFRQSLESSYPFLGKRTRYEVRPHAVWQRKLETGEYFKFLVVSVHDEDGRVLVPAVAEDPELKSLGELQMAVTFGSKVAEGELQNIDAFFERVSLSLHPALWRRELLRLLSKRPHESYLYNTVWAAIESYSRREKLEIPKNIDHIRYTHHSNDGAIDAALLVRTAGGDYLLNLWIARDGWAIPYYGGMTVGGFFQRSTPVTVTAWPYEPDGDYGDDDPTEEEEP